MRQLTKAETDYNFDRHFITFLQESAFYAELSRHVKKVLTRDIPTAAVAWDMAEDQLTMYANPDFLEKQTNSAVKGTIVHEFDHIIFGHLSARRREPPMLWNAATDLAINSLIVTGAEESAQRRHDGGAHEHPLPRGVLIPGRWPEMPDGRELKPEEKKGAEFASLIASFPKNQASEWYFAKLQAKMEQMKKKKKGTAAGGGLPVPGQGGGDGDPGDGQGGRSLDDVLMDSFDDHSMWDDVPEEVREYIEGKVKAIVEKAVREADQNQIGWGNIPADVREAIRRSVSSIVNWRSVLRQFIGTTVRGARTTSIKRINKRYPYIHPGTKRGYQAKLLIAIDQSGSVCDEMLTNFFAELTTLTKRVDVSILPFDCSADVKDVFEWKKGTTLPLKRVKHGGTDFDAPTHVLNDQKNRGRWDGMLILTDGQAPAPKASRVKRGWVLGKGCKLYFPSSELQIFLDKENNAYTGAWR